MAKVVLVWNEHPTEVVAGYHARKVAKILKEKYGHEVILEKIPVRETNYGIVRRVGKGVEPKRAAQELVDLEISLEKAAKAARKHQTPAFNFHASEHTELGNASTARPEHFNVEEVNPHEVHRSGALIKSEILMQWLPNTNHFVIEIPAFYKYMRKAQLEKHQKQVHKVFSEILAMEETKRTRMAELDTLSDYHTRYTPLNEPEQQKFLHPAISEKIAAAIHERITRK